MQLGLFKFLTEVIVKGEYGILKVPKRLQRDRMPSTIFRIVLTKAFN